MALRTSFDIRLANDGDSAVGLFKEDPAKAVLLDANMPGITGFEACRQIRSLPTGARVPILIATSMEESSAVDQAFEAGASDFLLKPLHLGVVGRKLLHLIRRQEAAPIASNSMSISEIPAPILRLNDNLEVTSVNEEFCRTFRLEAKTVLGRKWTTFTDCDGKGFDTAKLSPGRSNAFKAEVLGINANLKAAHLGAGGFIVVANAEQPQVQASVGAPAQAPDVGVLDGVRILILEDQDIVARSLMRLLGRTKVKITHTVSGEDAVTAVKAASSAQKPFNVLLLDLSIVGGKGGAEALREIRKIDADVPAIATSGLWKDPVMLNPSAHGFDAVLHKPFAREDLLERITLVLGKKAAK